MYSIQKMSTEVKTYLELRASRVWAFIYGY